MTRFCLGVTLGAAVVTLMLSPAVNAQSCVGNNEVSGAYAFVGSRSSFTTVSTGSVGTGNTGNNTGNPNVSPTPVGTLLGDLSGMSPFATVGRVVADGAGNLFAAPNATSQLTQVGTYTVNSDCTISVTMTDVFLGMAITPPGTATGSSVRRTFPSADSNTGSSGSSVVTGTTTTTGTPVSMTFQGIVLSKGAEIDLEQTTTTTTTTGSGTQTGTQTVTSTGAVIVMRRALQFSGCSDASLSGSFGLVSQSYLEATGTTTGSTGSTTTSLTPVASIGRLMADGLGNFVSNTTTNPSSIPPLQLTGSYTVNADCTGTAQIVDSTGAIQNISFVIVQGESTPSLTSPLRVSPEILFTYTDQNVSGFGTIQ